jgi:uncharacterized membrane protein
LATVKIGKFINRGFLNGPFCPVYGFGVIAVIILLSPVKWSLPLLFIGSILLASLIELITGYILEKNFKQKWWDYSDMPFNISGYICLKMSLGWGIASIVVIYCIQPIVQSFVVWLPIRVGLFVAGLMLMVLIVDTVVTIISLLKLKQTIRILNDTGEKIKFLSDTIGKNISDNMLNAIEIKDKRMQELDNLNKKYQAILSRKLPGYNRIAQAFPRLHLLRIKQPDKSSRKS